MSEVYGAKIEAQRRLSFFQLGAFTANTSVTPDAYFGCPPGVKGIRIIGIHLLCDDVPVDADGVMTVNVDVNDVSEGATDVIVSAEDLETLIVAADRWYEATLAADGTEKIKTIYPGDAVTFDLVSDSAAIDTTVNVHACIEWHPIPDHDDLDRVQHVSEY